MAFCVAAAGLLRPEAHAADHVDAPMATASTEADISDFYAWQDGDEIVAAIAFAGLKTAGSEGTYDDRTLYGVHLDTNADGVADKSIWIRFGMNDVGEWGVKLEDIPGGDEEVIGPVDTVLDAGLGLRAFAGVRDDPFFFDLDGFKETLGTATLAFDGRRDSFLGTNVTMIVLEMSVDGAAGGSSQVQLWATSAQRGGN
jgi:hypothetical protein